VNFRVLDFQPPNAHRQLEPSGPGAARIEIEHVIFHLLFGNVTMAGDNDGKSSRFGFEIEAAEIVQYVDGCATYFEDICVGNLLCPCSTIDVAANRGYGSNT